MNILFELYLVVRSLEFMPYHGQLDVAWIAVVVVMAVHPRPHPASDSGHMTKVMVLYCHSV